MEHSGTDVQAAKRLPVKEEPQDEVYTHEQWLEWCASEGWGDESEGWGEWYTYESYEPVKDEPEPEEEEKEGEQEQEPAEPTEAAEAAEPAEENEGEDEIEELLIDDSDSSSPGHQRRVQTTVLHKAMPVERPRRDVPPPPPVPRKSARTLSSLPPPPPPTSMAASTRRDVPVPPPPPPPFAAARPDASLRDAPWRRETSGVESRASSSERSGSSTDRSSRRKGHGKGGEYVPGGHGFRLASGEYSACLYQFRLYIFVSSILSGEIYSSIQGVWET